MGIYQIFERFGAQVGGMCKVQGPATAPSWLSYVQVTDSSRAVGAAKGAGGRLLHGPIEVPGGSWIALFMDPQGGAFAVHEMPRVAKPAAPPKPVAAAPKAAAATPAPKPAAAPTAPKPAAPKAAAPKKAARKKPAKRQAARKKVARKKSARKPARRKPARRSAKRRPAKRKTARRHR
jgi:hypothetical protein